MDYKDIPEKFGSSRWDRYLGMTAAITQVPVPTATNVILNDSPQTIRFKNLRDDHVKQMFESEL